MITATNILYIYTESPLHAGTGSGLSNVDLPIQRERTTQYPMMQGSGIKGKLRTAAEEDKQLEDLVDIIFGSSREIKGAPPNGTAQNKNGAVQQDYAGALIVGDARILLFPVRSLNGIFAYTTSYDVLQRFARDLERSQVEKDWSVPDLQEEQNAELPTALVTSPSDLTIEIAWSDDPQSNAKTIVLEEFSFKAQELEGNDGSVNKIANWLATNALPQYGPGANGAYWQNKLRRSLVILPNDDFRDFVLYATEVITRIGIERQTKIVKEGALWTNAGTPIHLPTGVVDFLNVLCPLLVFPLMLTHRTLLPGIVATERHPQGLTEDRNGILLAILFHDLVPHSWPCEKILTVFFRISRSWRVLSSSRLSRHQCQK